MNRLIIFFLLFQNFTFAQNELNPMGRIVYSMNFSGKISYIEMHYTNQNYIYKQADFFDSMVRPFSLENELKKLEKLEEDMQKGQISIGTVNKFLANHTFWQGEVGSNLLIVSNLINFRKKLCTVDTLRPISWKLIDGSETIEGKKCQMAEGNDPSTGNKFIAYYDPTIPISFAPFQLSGLPGLMMKMKSLNTGAELKVVSLSFPVTAINLETDLCQNCKLVSLAQKIKESQMENERMQNILEKWKNGASGNVKDLNNK